VHVRSLTRTHRFLWRCYSSCTSKITDIGLSYTARGEPSDVYESTPHSAGYYHATATYWTNGALDQLTGPALTLCLIMWTEKVGSIQPKSLVGKTPLAYGIAHVAVPLVRDVFPVILSGERQNACK